MIAPYVTLRKRKIQSANFVNLDKLVPRESFANIHNFIHCQLNEFYIRAIRNDINALFKKKKL